MHHHAISVETDELLVRPVAEMHNQPPGERKFRGLVVGCWPAALGGWVGARVQVVEESDGQMPFQWDSLEGEPPIMRL